MVKQAGQDQKLSSDVIRKQDYIGNPSDTAVRREGSHKGVPLCDYLYRGKHMPYSRGRSGSVGTLSEFLKRKREGTEKEDREIEDLRQSKLVTKYSVTNPKQQHIIKTADLKEDEKKQKMEKKIDEMSKMLAGILERMEDIKEIKSELKELKKENIELKNEVEQIRNMYKDREEDIKKEKMEWKRKLQEVEERLDKKERHERKNNIIIKGLQLQEDGQTLQNWLKHELNVDVKILETHKIGKKKERPTFLARINTWEEKMEVMKNKYKLKNQAIFIENDMTVKEREIQKKLRQISEKEKINGKRTKVSYRKIKIDDTWFVWDEETEDIKNLN